MINQSWADKAELAEWVEPEGQFQAAKTQLRKSALELSEGMQWQ